MWLHEYFERSLVDKSIGKLLHFMPFDLLEVLKTVSQLRESFVDA